MPLHKMLMAFVLTSCSSFAYCIGLAGLVDLRG